MSNSSGSQPSEMTLPQSIPISQIAEQRYARRSNVTEAEVSELAQSILSRGLLNPIIVSVEEDHYRLVAGRRRLLAMRHLGWTEAPCWVKHYTEQDSALTALAENLARSDMRPLDEARTLDDLIRVMHYNITQAASAVGRSPGWVAARLQLLTYPTFMQNAVDEGHIGISVAQVLMKVDDPEQLEFLTTVAMRSGATANQVRQWVQDWQMSMTKRTEEELQQIATAPVGEPPPVHHKCLACDGVYDWRQMRAAYVCECCIGALDMAKKANELEREVNHYVDQ